MKELLIVLLLMSFVVSKEIKCQPNEALNEQTQKCEKKCEEGKVFNSDTLSCEIYSANITCPEGQIFNNHTSSCEDKKVDTTTENDDGTTQDGDGTTQDDDLHELVYNIKSKRAGRILRKLEDEKQRIFITINEKAGKTVSYLKDSFFYSNNQPNEVYLNKNKSMNYNSSHKITLDRDGENIIEVVWNQKLTTLEYIFYGLTSVVSIDLSNFDTSNAKSMFCMFSSSTSLVSVDLSGVITSNVTTMENMFGACTSLVSLDLSSFITSKVTSMYCMFCSCKSLVSLDISNFNASNVKLINCLVIVFHYNILIYSTI